MALDIGLDIDEAAWPARPDWEAVVTAAAGAALAQALGDDFARRGLFAVDIVLADDETVATLNGQYRRKPYPTNVLSFPSAPVTGLPDDEPRPLGDIVLAAGVVAREAKEGRKTLAAHVSHLVVHGMLHLLGYDHETDAETEELAALEVAALKRLDIADPYADHEG
ncbi:MAG: rRNA maturation RNase YbeY [Hyphomicrobiales bacterium]